MKKFLALVLCLTLVLTCFAALLGCDGNESGDTQSGISVPGGLYEIDEAYELGLLTADDIQHINYYMRGYGLDANGKEIDFAPTKEYIELTTHIRTKINDAIIDKYEEDYLAALKHGEHIEDLIMDYFGFYGGCFVVKCYPLWMEGTYNPLVVYGDVGWHRTSYVQAFVCET